MIAITVPPECRPSRVAIERIRGAAKNGRPRRLRCKGKGSAQDTQSRNTIARFLADKREEWLFCAMTRAESTFRVKRRDGT